MVVEFYINLSVLDEYVVTLTVKGVEIIFDPIRLGEILQVPSIGLNGYYWTSDGNYALPAKFSQRRVKSGTQTVLKGVMTLVHKILFGIVHKGVLEKGHKCHIASLRNMGFMNALECKEPND